MSHPQIAVIEPTYGDVEHAAVNAGILQAIALAMPGGNVTFASTPAQRAGVMNVIRDMPAALAFHDIDVMPPGGISLHRAWAQWTAIAGHLRRQAPKKVVLLSSGPETLFVCRVLATMFRGMDFFVVQHGNLTDAVGWRSRDPRHRLFDYPSGLAVADHPNIRLVVLEDGIRAAAGRLGINANFLVWPHPLNKAENAPRVPWMPVGPIRIAFVGAAKRAKGFDEFLGIARDVQGGACQFELVGYLYDKFAPEELDGVAYPETRLPRDGFIAQLRRADYAFMAFKDDVYNLTASGSLLDCIGQLKPVIAVETPLLAAFTAKYGSIGHVCRDLDHVRRLLADPERLLDRTSYEGFQGALERIRYDRSPAALANILREHLDQHHLPDLRLAFPAAADAAPASKTAM